MASLPSVTAASREVCSVRITPSVTLLETNAEEILRVREGNINCIALCALCMWSKHLVMTSDCHKSRTIMQQS
jgi:hypothetical protein